MRSTITRACQPAATPNCAAPAPRKFRNGSPPPAITGRYRTGNEIAIFAASTATCSRWPAK